MNTDSTGQRGLRAVIEYEARQTPKRVAERVHKCGYDLVSKGGGEERHIEVKATTKSRFTFRWLERLEYDQLQKDKRFYLYLVTDVSTKPRVFEYDRAKVMSRFAEEICHYVFVFPKDDFTKKTA